MPRVPMSFHGVHQGSRRRRRNSARAGEECSCGGLRVLGGRAARKVLRDLRDVSGFDVCILYLGPSTGTGAQMTCVGIYHLI